MRDTEKKLDREFSKYIRERDGWRCVLCGSMDRPECGHVFPRYARSTRWDKDNAFCMCHKCNQDHESDPKPYYEWYKKRFGPDAFDALRRKHNRIVHLTALDIEGMLNEHDSR